MNIYDVFFERLSKVFGKNVGLTSNPEGDANDGAFVTTIIFSFVQFLNIGTILLIVNHFIKLNLRVIGSYFVIVLVALTIFNYFYFVFKKKYVGIRDELSKLPENERLKYNIISFVYFLGSPILFFILLSN